MKFIETKDDGYINVNIIERLYVEEELFDADSDYSWFEVVADCGDNSYILEDFKTWEDAKHWINSLIDHKL